MKHIQQYASDGEHLIENHPNGAVCIGRARSTQQAIEIADALNQSFWISVEDELPELDCYVLAVWRGEPRVAVMRRETPAWDECFMPYNYWDDPHNDGQDWEWGDVTYWKYLPKMPEVEQPLAG